MNWDAMSAVGEILGAIALLIAFIYSVKQIRQNTQKIRAGRAEAVLKDHARYDQMLAENEDLARIYWAAIDDVDPLSDEEKLRWLHMCPVMMRNSGVADFHFRHGDRPQELYRLREPWIRRYLGESGFRWWWRPYADVLDLDFVRHADDVLGSGRNAVSVGGAGKHVSS